MLNTLKYIYWLFLFLLLRTVWSLAHWLIGRLCFCCFFLGGGAGMYVCLIFAQYIKNLWFFIYSRDKSLVWHILVMIFYSLHWVYFAGRESYHFLGAFLMLLGFYTEIASFITIGEAICLKWNGVARQSWVAPPKPSVCVCWVYLQTCSLCVPGRWSLGIPDLPISQHWPSVLRVPPSVLLQAWDCMPPWWRVFSTEGNAWRGLPRE